MTILLTRRALGFGMFSMAAAGLAGRETHADFVGIGPSPILTTLDEKRVLATVEGPAGVISEDAGRTWSQPFRYQQQGKPLRGKPFPTQSVFRLRNGHLGMFYSNPGVDHVDDGHEGMGMAGYSIIQWFFATSSDEGRNWSAGAPVDAPAGYDLKKGVFCQYLWGNAMQLSSGRIICPAYWEMGSRHPEFPPQSPYPVHGYIGKQKAGADGHLYEATMGGSYVYYSDNLGKNWTRSAGSVMVWPLPGENGTGGFGGTYEPVIAELKDGRLLMLLRTHVGRIFRSISDDGGEHWHQAQATELASGDVPCWIGRLRTTGNLLVVWNQASTEEIQRGYSRCRLSAAISKDEGSSWAHFQTIDIGGGLQHVDRVSLPPIRHVRANVDLGNLPEDYSKYHYPVFTGVQGKLLLVYNADVGPAGKLQRKLRLKIIPEEHLYL